MSTTHYNWINLVTNKKVEEVQKAYDLVVNHPNKELFFLASLYNMKYTGALKDVGKPTTHSEISNVKLAALDSMLHPMNSVFSSFKG